jgi:hypothetical protein
LHTHNHDDANDSAEPDHHQPRFRAGRRKRRKRKRERGERGRRAKYERPVRERTSDEPADGFSRVVSKRDKSPSRI